MVSPLVAGGMEQPVTKATESALSAGRSRWLRLLAQLGLAARGVTYLLLGWLVLSIALGRQQHQASDKGAFQALASQPGGKAMLIVLSVGFGAFALWAAIRLLAPRRSPPERGSLAHRLGAAGQAVVYGFLCYLAAVLVVGGSSGGSGDPAPLTAAVMRAPAGRLAVVVVGGAVVAVGLILVVRAAIGTFEDDLELGRLRERTRRTVRALGTVGTVARGAVVVIVGGFLLAAGIDHRAGQAKGLDASLVAVGHHAYGMAVLVGVAVGLACFGVFSIVSARYRRLGG